MNLNIIWEGLLLGEGGICYFVIFGICWGGAFFFLVLVGVVALGFLLKLLCVLVFFYTTMGRGGTVGFLRREKISQSFQINCLNMYILS